LDKTEEKINLKYCSGCDSWLPKTEEFFRKRSVQPHLFRSGCKKCTDNKYRNPEYHKQWYEKNSESEKQRFRTAYHNNLDKGRERVRKSYLKHKEKCQAYHKKRSEDLVDSLIRNRIVSSSLGLTQEDITPQMIETKRLITQLIRQLK
jgi:hypothetical protein